MLIQKLIDTIDNMIDKKDSIKNVIKVDDGIEAREIADKLNIDRSAASRYLNELVRSKYLIKINTRPVLFYHKKRVESLYQTELIKTIYNSFEELVEALSSKKDTISKDPFMPLIGYSGSLRQQIEQCKAAISYPPRGLPFIITGETGVGKSYLVERVYQYAIVNNIITKDAPFSILNCAEFANNPELVTANLFGYKKGAFTGADKDTRGIIESSDGGILFLDEVHRLTPEGQEKLFLFMDRGVFHPLGDNSNWKHANVRLIFATTENLEQSFLSTFLRRIPIVLSIPPLQERTENEKYSLIYNFYKKESKNIKKKFAISKRVIEALITSSIKGNIGELKNIITYSCASSYTLMSSEETIEISLKNLPSDIVRNFIVNNDNMNQLQSLLNRTIIIDYKADSLQSPYPKQVKKNPLNDLYEDIFRLFQESKSYQFYFDEFFKRVSLLINQYVDRVIFSTQRNQETLEFATLKHFINNLIDITDMHLKTHLTGNAVITLTHLILNAEKAENPFDETIMEEFWETTKEHFSQELDWVETIVSEIEHVFDISLRMIDVALITIYISSLSKRIHSNRIKAVIIAHGYSTASSISNVANQLLGEYIFEAFDMPISLSPTEVFSQLHHYLSSVDTSKGIIIFVDMGSLTQIENYLENLNASKIGILNNITTNIAIEAGEKIIKGVPIEKILQEIKENQKPTYRLIEEQETTKNPAIITTCITGIGTAVKIKELLDKGLNQYDTKVQVIPYDFLSLRNNGIEDSVFKDYTVLGIVGTVNPNITDIEFVAIEDIITGKEDTKLNTMLCDILHTEGIESIIENIIKLFSLQSVINHLTILNPDKIIDDMSQAIGYLEHQLNIHFPNQTRISLYVHLSCLIERLIKQNPIEDYHDLYQFNTQHKTFIRIIKSVFADIERNYGVEIPYSEIGYIYDIIKLRCEQFAY